MTSADTPKAPDATEQTAPAPSAAKDTTAPKSTDAPQQGKSGGEDDDLFDNMPV